MGSIQQSEIGSRFWPKVDRSGECWVWTGGVNASGYGVFGVSGRSALAHRVAYEMSVGPIAHGLTLDHLCRNRRCVRPAHMKPCSQRDNLLAPGARTQAAVNSAKTHCKKGHEFTEANTYRNHRGHRECRQCRADLEVARRARAGRAA